MKVDFYKDKQSVIPIGRAKDVIYYLERIRYGEVKETIEALRAELDKPKRDLIKGSLSAVTFCGTFTRRAKTGLKEASGLAIIDFDKLKSFDDVKLLKDKLSKDPYIFSAWVSPSGNGLKALVKIPIVTDNEDYNRRYKAIYNNYKWVNDEFGENTIDTSGQDVSRLCFESYDADLYVNDDSLEWTELKEVDIYEVTEEVRIPIKSDNEIISRLLKWFNKFSMASGERNANLFKLASALNDYGISLNEAMRVCLQYQQKDFTQREIDTTVKSAYKKTSQHHTKFFEDIHTKKRVEELIRSGKDIKMVRKAFPELNDDEFDMAVESVKDNISVTDFWEYTAKGNVVVQLREPIRSYPPYDISRVAYYPEPRRDELDLY